MKGIADYIFVRDLPKCNFGRYYLARPPGRLHSEAEFVVVKVFAGDVSDKTFRRATRELRAFAAVRSPYLVRLLDAGQQGGTFFYAMQHTWLGNLLAPERPLSRSDRTRAVAHAARGAHALHEGGIVHRDIRPENVLLTETGACLSDLGLARVLHPGVTMTTSMGPVASLEYVDPEVIRGGRVNRQTDVYALGVTLHRAVTGRSVFGELPEDQPLLAMRAVVSEKPRLVSSLEPRCAALVAACLDPDVRQRPATAMAVAEEIEALPAA